MLAQKGVATFFINNWFVVSTSLYDSLLVSPIFLLNNFQIKKFLSNCPRLVFVFVFFEELDVIQPMRCNSSSRLPIKWDFLIFFCLPLIFTPTAICNRIKIIIKINGVYCAKKHKYFSNVSSPLLFTVNCNEAEIKSIYSLIEIFANNSSRRKSVVKVSWALGEDASVKISGKKKNQLNMSEQSQAELYN